MRNTPPGTRTISLLFESAAACTWLLNNWQQIRAALLTVKTSRCMTMNIRVLTISNAWYVKLSLLARESCQLFRDMPDCRAMKISFQRRGIVEGFFGPLWSMAHRKAMFKFGAVRGMNTYLYAPKDDPYHRERWTEPYPRNQWRALLQLI